jgi:site-specific DNA-methyltransferase (adenine-specific)
MNIETLRIAELTPDPNNARQHDDKNLKAIMGSLKEFGQRKPIVITEAGTIVAGNGTVEAAKRLGWLDIEVVKVPNDWTDAQVKAFAIADNRTAELANWNQQVLTSQLLELEAEGWELTEFGFEPLEMPVNPDDIVEDEIPDSAPIRTALGDVWRLGNHRLMCGDSVDDKSVDKLLDGNTVDLVFTDPPYGVAYTGGLQFKSDGEVVKNNREMIENDDIDIYEDVMRQLARVAQGPTYIWFAGTKAASLYQAAEKYGDIHALIIWVKNGGYGALNANYKQKHEPCLYWKPKGKTLNFTGATTETTIWNIDKDGKNKLHPTQKPISLAAKAIGNHKCITVLDLFGGSGSTLIASEEMNKKAFVMELDPKYCDVIIERWEKLTGQKAELLPAKAD